MTKFIATMSVLLIVATSGGGEAYAGKFNIQRAEGQNVSVFNPVSAFGQQPYQCVSHGHHQCPNPPGSTLPPCRGGHMGPNGVMIECK